MIQRALAYAAMTASLLMIPSNAAQAITEAEVRELCANGCVLLTQQQFDAAMQALQRCNRI